VRWLALAPVVAALTLSACGFPGANAQTLDAQTVLLRAQSAAINDLTFTADGTFAVDLGGLAQATGSSTSTISLDATIAGKITKSPQRADLSLSTSGSQDAMLEIITDSASQSGYLNVPALGQLLGNSAGGWIKLPIGDVSSVIDTSLFDKFEQLTEAKNVGSDSIGGVSVWHLQGKQTFDGANATEDFYVRQDNYYPVKVVVKGDASVPTAVAGGAGGAGATVNVTINITKINSGLTIALPATS
jgi:hypothetical protein